MKHNLFFRVLCAGVFVAMNYGQGYAQGTISTVAGTGAAGYAGDGGKAALGMLSSPSGVATDGAGNIYIADYGNHRVRMISPAGIISSVAGNGSSGYSGMGGPAIAAGIQYPNSLFVDATGNYYITDLFSDCAYSVTRTSGAIANICGHNIQGSAGDGGIAPAATMEAPKQVWKDKAGNTYIADYGNNKVRKIDAGSNVVNTLTGGVHGFSPDGTSAAACHWGSINGVCADDYGNVFVSDAVNHVVRKIDVSGNVKTIAGTGVSGYYGDGGAPLSATFKSPGSLFINSDGYLFICDGASNVVRVMNVYAAGSTIKTLAGNGTKGFSGDGQSAETAQLNDPSGVWESASGTIYIADNGNNRVRAISGSGYRTGGNSNANSLSNVSIFPNPSNGSFAVIGSSLPANTSLEIYNMLGEKVYSQALGMQYTNVTLDQPSGIYNVVLKSSGTTTNQKIVISR